MRDFVSEKVKQLPYSGIREIFDLAAGLDDVIHFEIGEPDFDTPLPIVNSAFEAVKKGMTHYTSSAGLPALRAKLADQLAKEIGALVLPDEIVITAGGMEALFLLMSAVLDQDDEVLFPTPHWPNYAAHVLMGGGRYRKYRLDDTQGFRVDLQSLEAQVSPATKVLLINSPHNPTGMVLSLKELDQLAQFAKEHDLLVCSDEAYYTLLFDHAEPCSIASLPGMKERTVVIRTFSKTYAMTGWRVGYLMGPKPLAQRIAKLHEHTSACTSSVSQAAGMKALDLPPDIPQNMVDQYQKRRDVLIEGLNHISNVQVSKPEGAFYAFVNVKRLGLSSFDLSRLLLEEAHVAVAPGTAFGKEGEGHIRLCFANSLTNIKEGLARMKPVLEALPK